MDYDLLKQHHDALKSENDSLKQVLDQERAEKLAIDQMFIKNVQETVQLRKHIILCENQIKNLMIQVAQKDDEIARLKEKAKSLESAEPTQEAA